MKHEVPFQSDNSNDPRWILVEECCKIDRKSRPQVNALLERFHILQLCNAMEHEVGEIIDLITNCTDCF